MRLAFRQNPVRVRALQVAAAAALLISFVLPYFFHPAGRTEHDWLDALRGLFAGVSIGMNLLLVRLRCRTRREPVKL